MCAAAMLAGNHNPTEIAEWVADLPEELRLRLHLRRSPSTGLVVAPSISTVQRTLRRADRQALDRVVCETPAEQVHLKRTEQEHDSQDAAELAASDEDGEGPAQGARADDESEGETVLFGVAVDGKTLRGAVQDDGRAVHLFAAMTHDERVVIGQEEVDRKTNEIKAFRPLLRRLDLAGCIVTGDAMHAQSDHAEFLVEEKHADFLLFVKENQPSVYHAAASLADDAWSEPYIEVARGHGRIETRSVQVAPATADLPGFPHVAQVLRIVRKVEDAKTGTARWTETVYAVTSCSAKRAGRQKLASAARGHWGIGNGLHWVRDWCFDEDRHQLRSTNTARALATLRNLAISLLRLAGAANITAATRWVCRDATRAAALLGV
ncbi:MAG: ISAs1 family transposase [Acidimicrobiales bacterium]